ncbi:V-type ATP synthase subunit F [Halalkalicoccus sp. NIPERK01]|uniref:V-type ATP synthase subunit F n=1 Tax=Halalkalicoccus sp. NIPERK01 TaxID=3053469 RepID=UPI00256EFD18|nr:V-type ATP synthase subunit F [Halalkalicoccus sp. NIPERK01]MDL5363552.1 V-type ATP synthase subunit F [Halalkalicoccus sp. NIPERK01]
MSQEIAAIGSPEFTTGFRLAGVRVFENVPDDEKAERLDEAVANVLENDEVGIAIMHEEDLEYLSRNLRRDVETSVEPTFVMLGGGAGSGGLREKIKRAIGIDLMDEDS